MNNKDGQTDDYRSFLLLDEISKNEELTQRALSKKLGLALGLINSYIKNLASKGYITVSAIPKNRYKYYLTPHGFAEKTRLTYQHLQNFTTLYRVARRDFHTLFGDVALSNIKTVAFCGVDEVTEIAYLSLKEAGLELAGIVDDGGGLGRRFFGLDILPLKDAGKIQCDLIIITSFNSGERLRQGLIAAGVRKGKICGINTEGWLKRIDGGGVNHDQS
ncbi:MAG: winged helix-turn-helix transcriptional regulator [Deltaproteobacteria bacterium]|nr:winged helix-turn-helix transcriptional regulator [Deltaproteobacteria bacterium]